MNGQSRADERILDLLTTPAAVRFASYEPALEPVDFRLFLHDSNCIESGSFITDCICSEPRETHLDWIICGGESGLGRRHMQMEWAEDVMRQCRTAGTAFFFKQDSGPRPGMRGRASDELWACKQFPEVVK